MQLINLFALSLLTASACAADCWGDKTQNLPAFAAAYWDARAKMCGNTDCPYQKDCTTYSSKVVQGLFKLKLNVSINRKKVGAKGFKHCWDATEDIINQCVYKEGRRGGVWAYDGQVYIIDASTTSA